MAAAIITKCPVCGKQHTFYLANTFNCLPWPNAEYSFRCPTKRTNGTAVFGPRAVERSQWWQIVKSRPDDSIEVQKV
jgi:hypothetical protein